jgi:hypothetical protein
MIFGALIGLAGSAMNRAANYAEKRQEMQSDEAKREHEFRMATAEHQMQKESAETQADSDLRSASYKHDAETVGASKWVINIIRLVRPIVTGYALVLETIIWFALLQTGNEKLQEVVVLAVLDTAACAITWWFGDRSATSYTRRMITR